MSLSIDVATPSDQPFIFAGQNLLCTVSSSLPLSGEFRPNSDDGDDAVPPFVQFNVSSTSPGQADKYVLWWLVSFHTVIGASVITQISLLYPRR